MSGNPASAYLWLKAFHIIAVTAWMAGLLYLPRLFVYHTEAPAGSSQAAAFSTMEHRLLRMIMLPAAVMTYLFGAILAGISGIVDWRLGWIWTKLVLVLALTAFHLACVRWHRGFAAGTPPHSARFFRVVNELPTLALIAIVVLVVVKPF